MYSIINMLDSNIDEINELDKYVKFVVSRLELKICEFNIIIVDNEEIRKINNEWRGIDKETDVISFALEDDMDDNVSLVYDHRVLGDIYISYDKVCSQALEYGHSKLREICFLATHGILHLLGYDHMNKVDEDKMFSLQDELLSLYGIERFNDECL